MNIDRDLNDAETDGLNEILAYGVVLGDLAEKIRVIHGVDQRWLSIGVTDLQTGLMALTRAIAQPTTF